MGADSEDAGSWELEAESLGGVTESLILGVERKDSLELRVWGLQPAAIAGKSGFGS